VKRSSLSLVIDWTALRLGSMKIMDSGDIADWSGSIEYSGGFSRKLGSGHAIGAFVTERHRFLKSVCCFLTR
jgi:hypothetical protein